MLSAGMVQAQLKVDSLGRLGLSTLSTHQQSNVYLPMTNNYGLKMEYAGNTSGTVYGLHIDALHKNNTLYNIFSRTTRTSTSSGPGYGVYSVAMGNTSNMGYALYGLISSRGAAVYGTISGNSNYSLNTSYAGYFNGLTHVQGDLSVSGNISGVLLTSSVSPSVPGSTQSVQALSVSKGLCENLQGLTANTYYYNPPRLADGVDEDITDLSS